MAPWLMWQSVLEETGVSIPQCPPALGMCQGLSHTAVLPLRQPQCCTQAVGD